jgi:hypothetical protein
MFKPLATFKPLAAAAMLCLAGSAAIAADQDFALFNETGYTIDKVYVSPVGKTTWGGDILGQDQLEDGNKVNVTFKNGNSVCQYDLKVVYTDDDSAVWSDLNLCDLSKIHLHYDRKAGVTRASTE